MSSDLARALDRFSALVDEKTGLIRRVEIVRLSEIDPRVFMAYAVPCDTVPLSGMPAANRGGACSVVLERAIVRACGESIERYCSAFFDRSAMPLSSPHELSSRGLRHIALTDLFPFAPQQYEDAKFPYIRPTSDTPLRWVQGTLLRSGLPVQIPASCVYVPYAFDENERQTHMPISTGLAAGPTVEFCVRKGIFEILERDALMIVWAAHLPRPRIDPQSCAGVSEEIDEMLGMASALDASWFLNVLTLDVDVPIISAVLINHGSPPLTSFGIAADTDIVHALRLALEEALLTRVLVVRSDDVAIQPSSGEKFDGVRTLRDHLRVHAGSDALRGRMRFLVDDPPSVEFAALVHRACDYQGELADRLAAAELEAAWVDVTTEDVAAVGLRVVKTVIPSAQPLDNDHDHRFLGGPRLYSIARRFGRDLTIETVNPDPHPFP